MAQRLPTVSGDGGTWGTVLNGYLGPALGNDGSLWLNVRDPAYGAKGDDATDDTTAIQNAITAAAISVSRSITVFFPPGTYKITSQLTIPTSPGIRLVGTGMYGSVIKQYTDNTAIIRLLQVGSGDLSPPLHSFEMKDLGLTYSVARSSTGSNAVFYDWAAPSTTGSGFFHHLYDRIRVENAYCAWSHNKAHGIDAVWDSTWRGCVGYTIYQSFVDLVSAGTTGQPCLRFYDCYISNAGATSHGAMFNFEAVNEILFMGLDAENWYNEIVVADNCNVTMLATHLENNTLSNAFAYQFNISNGTLMMDGFTLNSTATTAGCTNQASMVNLGVLGDCTIKNGQHSATLTLGTHTINDLIYATQGNGSHIRSENLTRFGGFLNPGDPGTAAGTLSAVVGGFWNLAFSTTPIYGFDGAIYPVGVYKSEIPNGTAFSVGTPTNLTIGRQVTYWIKNASGTNLGAVNWGTIFLLPGGTFTRPSNGKNTMLTFVWDGTNMCPMHPQTAEF